jgi:hypothetical protein
MREISCKIKMGKWHYRAQAAKCGYVLLLVQSRGAAWRSAPAKTAPKKGIQSYK